MQLLIENVGEDGVASGTSCRYAQVKCELPEATENDLVNVKIQRVEADHLVAQAI